MAARATPMVCPEERPLVRPQAQTLYPIGTPTPRRGCRGASGMPPASMTRDNFAARNSLLIGPDAPTPAREQGLQPYGALFCFAWRSDGDWGRAESPQCARRRIPLPRWGLTRRLRRGLGLAVPWDAHTFLSVAKEKCAKESQRHGDSRGGPPRCASRALSCGSPFGGCPRPRFASLTRREKGFYCPF